MEDSGRFHDGHVIAARITVLVGAWLLVPTMIGEAQQGGAAAPPVPLVDGTKTLIMQPEQALTGARVMGDPAKPGCTSAGHDLLPAAAPGRTTTIRIATSP
jgi:hypothetical protein